MNVRQQVIEFLTCEAMRGNRMFFRALLAALLINVFVPIFQFAALVGDQICIAGPKQVSWTAPLILAVVLCVPAYLGYVIGRLDER